MMYEYEEESSTIHLQLACPVGKQIDITYWWKLQIVKWSDLNVIHFNPGLKTDWLKKKKKKVKAPVV